jgi:phosphohistidine swiveling domain-containing protein
MGAHFVRGLDDLSPEDQASAGAKAYSLARLLKLGLPVPPGFVLLSPAFDAFLDHCSLRTAYERLASLVESGASEADDVAKELARQLASSPLPGSVAAELTEAVQKLAGPVAIRSSATVEDTDTAAWAGQLETFMNVPRDDISSAVARAWASLFSERAIAYARHRHISLENARVAVILQENIEPAASGVVFTADPIANDPSQLVLEAVFGLGEMLVGGTTTPDSYWIDKKTLVVKNHHPASQRELLTLKASGGTQQETIGAEDSSRPKLTPSEVETVTSLALTAEREWGRPLDVEWCKDQAGKLYLLQARPITTLPRATPEEDREHRHPKFAKSITRGWSLLFCQIWHRAYTEKFYEQFGWGLSDVLYEGIDGTVSVYRAPSEFVTEMTRLVTERIERDPKWMQKQAQQVMERVDATRAWLATVKHIPLSAYTSEQLAEILKDFVKRNAELGPGYVLMLWFPIRMEDHPDRDRYADAINAAVDARIRTHSIGGAADEFARQLAVEVLARNGLPTELSRGVPLKGLERLLAGESVEENTLRGFCRHFLVSREEDALHEDAETYCVRKGIPIELSEESLSDEGIATGVTAFPGKVRGEAQVVHGAEDFSAFRDGGILITSMTTPDFEVVMGRAAGIVTDEGGVTSHAAILARELQKPTVIGTGVATQMFTSGDLAEVNADEGFAQKLPVGDRASGAGVVDQRGAAKDRHHGAKPVVFVLEDNDETRRELVDEFYRQAGDSPLRVIENGDIQEAVEDMKRLRDKHRLPDAVVSDLLLAHDPTGGVRFVEQIHREGYPAEQICVYSRMATALSKFDDKTRGEVFRRLAAVGVSRENENVFGKVLPGMTAIRTDLENEAGELANLEELVSAVLARVDAPVQARKSEP